MHPTLDGGLTFGVMISEAKQEFERSGSPRFRVVLVLVAMPVCPGAAVRLLEYYFKWRRRKEEKGERLVLE